MKDVHPHALRRPAHIAIVQCLARTVDLRRIDPAPTGLQHVDDAADDPPIIDPRLAARIVRQKRLEPSELIIR